jgi:hypothetical protein
MGEGERNTYRVLWGNPKERAPEDLGVDWDNIKIDPK